MIILDYSDRRPIYEQVIAKLEELILRGVLEENAPLPSVRQLAMDLAINPNTVQRSFAQLEKDGYLTSNRTAGRFVTEEKETLARLRDELKNRYIAEMLKKTEALGYTDEEIVNTIRERKTV